MKGRFVSFFRAFFGLGIFLLITTSCEIGLGAAVDTEAPSAAIVSPAVKEAVGHNITVSGTCFDDAKMDHLVIESLRYYETGEEITPLSGQEISTYNRGTEWSFTLNHEGGSNYNFNGSHFTLRDGTYTLSMKAYDEQGRISGIVSRSFDVDNTPPIFLLSKPNSLNIGEPTAYGKSVKILGTIADDHNIQKMTVYLYKEGETTPVVLQKSDFSGFDVSDTIVEIAKYYQDPSDVNANERIKHENYIRAYDCVAKGSQKFYLVVELTDAAGNSTRKTYIEENLSARLKWYDENNASPLKGSGISKLTGADMKKILTGMSEESQEVCDAIKSILAGDDDEASSYMVCADNPASLVLSGENSDTPLAIKMNVASNPKYTINNCSLPVPTESGSVIINADSWEDATTGNPLTILVQAGDDGIGVNPSTIAAKIYESPSATLTREELDELLAAGPSWTTPEGAANTYIYEDKGSGNKDYLYDNTSGVFTGSYQLDMPSDESGFHIVNGRYYIVEITGADMDDVELVSSDSSTMFGFHATGSGNAPTLDADNGQYIKWTDTGTINFKLSVNDSLSGASCHNVMPDGLQVSYDLYSGHIPSLTQISSFTKLNSGNFSGPSSQIVTNPNVTPSDSTYPYLIKLPTFSLAGTEKNYTYVLSVKGKNAGGETPRKQYLAYVDAGNPSIVINGTEFMSNKTILDTMCVYDAQSSQYKYNVGGTWSDLNGSGIKTLKYSVNGGAPVIISELSSPVSQTLNWTASIPVSESKGTNYSFTAEDHVGNSYTVNIDGVKVNLGAPEVSVTNLDRTMINSATSYDVTVTDGSGVKTFTIEASKNGGTYTTSASAGFAVSEVSKTSDATEWVKRITLTPTAADGVWNLRIKASDSDNRNATPVEFSVTVDGTPPVVQNAYTVNGYTGSYTAGTPAYFTSSTLTLSGTVNESTSGLKEIRWQKRRSNVGSDPSADDVVSGGNELPVSGKGNAVPFTLTSDVFASAVGDVHDKLYFVAVDNAGNHSAQPVCFDIYVDSTAPTFTATHYSVGDGFKQISGTVYHKGTAMALYGDVSDSGTGLGAGAITFTGISPTVYYSTSSVNDSNYDDDSIWSTTLPADGTTVHSWKAVFTPGNIGVDVTATAKDKAGKETQISVCTLAKDNAPPTVNILNIESNEEIFAGNETVENRLTSTGTGTYSLTVTGNWSDAVSGTNKLEYRIFDGSEWGNWTEEPSAPKSKNTVAWSFTVPITQGAEQKIEVRGTDEADNQSEPASVTDLKIDFSKPTLTVPTINPVYNLIALDANKSVEFVFSSFDSYNLESTSIKAVRGETEISETTSSAGIEINNNITLGQTQEATIKFTSPAADGTWTITATAKDKVGRFTESSVTLTVDGTKPVLSDRLSINDGAASLKTAYTDKYYNNTSLKFAGSVTETVEQGSVYYKLVRGGDTAVKPDSIVSDYTDVVAIGSDGTFNTTSTDFESDTDAAYNWLYIQAVDAAGNTSDVQDFPVHVDLNEAEIDVAYYANGDVVSAFDGHQILSNRNQSLTIYGHVSDDISGLNSIKFINGSTNITNKATVSYSTAAANTSVSDLTSSSTWGVLSDTNRKAVKWWKAVFASSDVPQGTVSVVSVDQAGNEGSTSFSVTVDTTPPTLHDVKLTGTGAYLTGTTYYIPKGSFTLSGTVLDNYAIGITNFSLKKNGTEIASDSTTPGDPTFSFTVNTSAWNDKETGSVTVKAVDAAGNVSVEKSFDLIVDDTAPSLLSNVFKAGYKYKNVDVKKDKVFFVGGGKYSESSFANKTSLSVSGYYDEAGSGIDRVYYIVTNVPSGSIPTKTADEVISGMNGYFSVSADGYTLPHYGTDVVDKYKTDANDNLLMNGDAILTENWPSSKYFSFGETLAGFAATSTSTTDVLYLVAVDKCGNKSAVKTARINVDLDAGSVDTNETESVPTNGSSQFTLTGTASDSLAGIEIINFRVGENDANSIYAYDVDTRLSSTDDPIGNRYKTRGYVRFYRKTGTTGSGSNVQNVYSNDYELIDFYRDDSKQWTGNPDFFLADGPNEIKWELTIMPDPTWFSSALLGSSPKVYATIKDWAGNVATYPVATLKVDTVSPTVSISSPSASSSVNGQLSVKGTVDDNISPKKVEIYTYFGNSVPTNLSGWTLFKGLTTDSTEAAGNAKLDSANLSEIYNFSIPGLNFNQCVAANSQQGKLYVLPVSYDVAGNVSIKTDAITSSMYTQYTVDLDSDRPEISFNEITGTTGYNAKYRSSVGGIIHDDDAITVVKISPNPVDDWEAYTQPAGTLECDTGSSTVTFTYTPADGSDGAKPLYIYVEDEQGGKFWTAHATTWMRPKVKFAQATDFVGLDGVVTYRFDSTPPAVKVYVASSSSAASARTAALNATDEATGIIRVGGSNTKFVGIKVLAKDENGIDGSSLTGTFGEGTPAMSSFSTASDVTIGTDVYKCWVATQDISSFGDGQKVCSVTVADNCGFESQPQVNFLFDKTGPVITMTTSQTVIFSGEVDLHGTTSDTLGSGVQDLKCFILTDDDFTGGVPNSDAILGSARTESPMEMDEEHTVYNWKFSPVLPAGSASALEPYDYAKETGDIYTLKLAFYAKDSLGNETLDLTKVLRYNPYGDRPIAVIVYPDVKEGAYSADMSGSVRVSGTAVDNVEVSKVFLQIAFGHGELKTESGISTVKNAASGDNSFWSKTALAAACPSYSGQIVTTSTERLSGGNFDADPNFWGIQVTSTESWYITLNKSREFQNSASLDDPNAAEKDKTYTIWIRAAAMDNNKLLGAWSTPVALSLNPNAPSIGGTVTPTVRFYTDAACTNAIAGSDIPYTPDMWISGNAKLITSAEHVNGISDLSYSVAEGDATATPVVAVSTNSETGAVTIANGASHHTGDTEGKCYDVEIILGTGSGGGSKLVQVSAIEKANGLSKTEYYTINYDNTAPTIGDFVLNDEAFAAGGKMQNSNLQLTVGGTVDDDDAGFERLLFYFYRSGTGNIYDPQLDYTDTSVSSTTALTSLVSSVEKNGEKLYSSRKTVSWINNTSFTMSEDVHVRKGGVAIINGHWYRIGSVLGTGTVTVNIEGGVADYTTAGNTVEFPYAQVVDNLSSETIKTWTSSSHSFRTGDDGDFMPESVSKSGTTWTWDATIHGNYIPDGPVTLVVFAADKAGNVSAKSVAGTLQNNPPRLAKVFLGTDLNADNKYSDSEFEPYDLYGVKGSYFEAYNLVTAGFGLMEGDEVVESTRPAFKAKNKLAVYAEFIGGKDPIKMKFTRNASEAGTHYTVDENSEKIPVVQKALGGAGLSGTSATNLDGENGLVTGGIYEVDNETLAGRAGYDNNDDGTVPVLLSFWDSTEDLEIGDTTQYSVLRIEDFTLDLTDVVNPTSAITPFYWKGEDDNSLYENSSANGHIELEDDWKESTGYVSNGSDAEKDGDPKVSGKIKIEGYAFDETRLSKILIKLDHFSLTSSLGTESGYLVAANCTGGVWTYGSSDITNGWKFEVDPEDKGSYFNQLGHKVKWTLSLDTEKVADLAQTDVKVTVISKDAANRLASTTANATEGDGTYNKPEYQMDVVPYITSLKTFLSSMTTREDASEYNRTAMGHYPVQYYGGEGETVTVNGFNLSSGVKTYKITNTSASGAFSVTVNDLVSLNNINYNDGHGSYNGGDDEDLKNYVLHPDTIPLSGDYDLYSNYYNRRPNNTNNNVLTDDVYIDVWTINNQAAVGETGTGELRDLVMKINQDNKLLGFAFTNGSGAISIPRGNPTEAGKERSNELWARDYDAWSAVGLGFDRAGNAYAVGAGGDINSSYSNAKWIFMTGRWGANLTSLKLRGAKDEGNSLRLEEIGQYGIKANASSGAKKIDKRRIKSPSIAANSFTGSGTAASTNVYLAYYDGINKEIRFKWGKFTASAKESVGYLNDWCTEANLGNSNKHWYYGKYIQVIADTLDDGTHSSGTLGNAGEYVCLDVIPSTDGAADTVVLVWYDGENTMYTYTKNDPGYKINDSTPDNMSGNATSRYTGTGTLTDYWATPKKIFTGAGEFCKVAVDGNGGVHIAACDILDGDLRYAYLSSPSAAYDEEENSVIVDSYGIVGTQLTLDVGLVGTKAVPYISYYAGSMPKMAYLPGGANLGVSAGAASELFTGKWECTYVPTSSIISEDRINVGLWKNATGGIIASQTGENDYHIGGNLYNGKCYGNGTSNAVVGYIRNEDGATYWVETAQMK